MEQNESRMPELESGMRVKLRNDMIFVVVKDLQRIINKDGFMELNFYGADGKYVVGSKDEDWDIVTVYEGNQFAFFFDIDYTGRMIWSSDVEKAFAREQRRIELYNQLSAIQAELNSLED
jgi:hypothetical protein